MERTQVLLYELNALVEGGTIPSVPVFIDSPLATRITQVYRGSPELFNDTVKAELKHDDVFDFPKLTFTASVEDSKIIDRIHQPKIIVAGSGMSVGGRVGRHEASYLPDPNSTVLLVGYQTIGTIGRKLQDGVKKIEINHETVKVRARVETILGYSAHKDSDHLLEFVADAAGSVKKVFVAMGEPKASLFLVQKLRDNLGVDAIYPERQKEYILM